MVWFERDPMWDLLREMSRLHDGFGRWLPGGAGAPAECPALNVWTSDRDAVVTAEAPGLDPKDLEISVIGDTLALRLSLAPRELKEDEGWHRQERPTGQFARTLRLPFQVEADQVNARLVHGVLQIVLPRAEEEKPRKISVRAE